MKKLIVVSFCTALSVAACAHDKKVEVPEAVKTAFVAKFPTAADAEWEVEKEGEYEVEFEIDDKEMSAVFNAQAVLLETEVEIAQADLPQSVQSTIASEFAGYKIEDVEKITNGQGLVTYEFKAEKEDLEVSIDASGKVIKKEAHEEEDEDRDDNKRGHGHNHSEKGEHGEKSHQNKE